ncbi:hypothetical protein [Haloactinospora alba]|uniref:hypothetical protein n=1 Tax=Haloactinospora alba TaxID=405555 RepID=UPI001476AA0C|nr:hypothetical protein [Haloactinospora alba]
MGALSITGLVALLAVMAVPVSIILGGVVYVLRVARRGPTATLMAASRRRELA